jgi:drug/metabolite transporter (DMT)-like permease
VTLPPSPVATRPSWSGFAMVALASASWGAWSLFLRPADLPSTVSSAIIFLVMGVAALPFALRGPPVVWDRTTIGLVVANTVFDALNIVTFFAAIAHTTIAIAVLTHYLAPILVALAAPPIDGVVTRGARPAAAVALLGLIIILEPWRAAADGAVLGAALGLASAVCYAGNVFTVRRIAARIGAVRALSYHSLLAAVVLAPLVIGQLDAVTARSLGLLAVGATTLGAASGVIFAVGLVRIGSARAAVLTFIEPIVAVAIGAMVWDERLHPVAALGGVLVLGAGIQVARKAR